LLALNLSVSLLALIMNPEHATVPGDARINKSSVFGADPGLPNDPLSEAPAFEVREFAATVEERPSGLQ
jgi:hypothetical protein